MMDAERVDRMVARLRARDVMAHRTEPDLYTFGIRVVIGDGSEALWTVGGAGGLDAQVVRDGVLVGWVPHVDGSESFTDEQTVEAIAAARYSEEGLRPPAPDDRPPPALRDPPPGEPGTGVCEVPARRPGGGAVREPEVATGHRRRAHLPWFRRRHGLRG